jgi:assimilatory nitrate reductase catalytic subunit
MTRTAKTPRLMAHIGEPFLEIHPLDAEAAGLEPAGLAKIESARGCVVLRVVITSRQRRGSVFAPMHWTDQLASNARINALVAGAVDPISGQPEFKLTPVATRPYGAAWHALAVSVSRPNMTGADYFALARLKHGFRAELAGLTQPDDWPEFARTTLALDDEIEWLAYANAAGGQSRFVAFRENRLVGAFFATREPVGVARSWIGECLGAEFAPAERLRLLAGRPGAQSRDKGAIVCACFEVGRDEILEAAARPGARASRRSA